jgi:hypothetical protein
MQLLVTTPDGPEEKRFHKAGAFVTRVHMVLALEVQAKVTKYTKVFLRAFLCSAQQKFLLQE